MKKYRNANIELIRIYACLIVVALHTWAGSGIDQMSSVVQGGIRIFVQHGVPLFLIIMGYYLFTSDKTFLIKISETFFRIIIPSFLAMCGYYLYCNRGGGEMQWYSFYAGILAGDFSSFGAAHLWYIFAYIEIIVAIPILKLICVNDLKHNYIRRYCMILSGLYIVFENIIYFLNGVLNTEFCVYNFSLINRNTLYVLIGYECYLLFQDNGIVKKTTLRLSFKKSRWFFLAVYVLCNVGVCLEELICLICFRKKQDMLYYSRYSALHFVSSSALFIFFMYMPLKNEKVNAVIRFIGDKTFYIYLIHYIFVQYIANNSYLGFVEKMPHIIKYGFTVLSVFGISLMCAVIIKVINAILRQAMNHLKYILYER